jgi:hypothetical protein
MTVRDKSHKVERREQQRALQRQRALARTQAQQLTRRRRFAFTGGGIVLAVLAMVAALYYTVHGGAGAPTTAAAADLGAPTAAIASPATDEFTRVATPVYQGRKPVLLFIGAQYCPHCAGQRWSVMKALDQFGTFGNVRASASSEGNIPTFDFTGAAYRSSFVVFDHKDVEDLNYKPLQSLDAAEQLAFNRYDTTGSIPLILAGGYAITGDAYNLADIDGLSFGMVQRALRHGARQAIVNDINAEANAITAFLCHADGMKPGSACNRPVISSIVRTLH